MLTFVDLTVQFISDWTASGEREVYIDFDIETYPLQIMTDSVVSSEDLLRVAFYTGNGSEAGGIRVKFTTPPSYWIDYCNPVWVTFTSIPDEQARTWTITETDTSVILACNGVEIFNYLFSESTTDNCVPTWSRDAVKMTFKSDDTASDEYRTKPTGKIVVI